MKKQLQTRTDVINSLIGKHKYKSYLEIGTQTRDQNFDKINVSEKTCVDPDEKSKADFIGTSDQFFSQNKNQFDLIFIDGLHHSDQVRKDIINASKCLTKTGAIVLHDLLPPNEKAASRKMCSSTWNGDCWRAAVGFVKTYNEVSFVVHTIDWGCGVIFPDGQIFEGNFEDMEMTFDDFNKNKESIFKLI